MKLFKKLVYLFALFPIVSTALYLCVMGLSTSEDFSFSALAIIGFLLVTAAWGYIGSLFAKSGNLLIPSCLVAHILPTITTVVYTVLFLVAQVNESAELEELAIVIGGLGTGFFGVIGTVLYAVIPMTLFEVYINYGFSVLVFIIGYAAGASRSVSGTKKPFWKNIV